jgi:DNA polymerase-3 subunit alpha
MRDCRSPSFGIPILPPSVNASDLDFTIEQAKVKRKTRPGIRYGLGAVKNAGEKAVEQIIGARQAGGPFKDVSDFCRRVDLRQVGKRALESLVKVGAFDDLGDRDVLLHTIDRMLKFSADDHHAREIGQISMFGEMSASGEDSVVLANVSPDERSSQRERLRWEKDLVGIYVSPHPLYELADQIQLLPNVQYAETLRRDPDEMNGRGVTVVGLVVGIRPITTRKGDLMAIISLEDVTDHRLRILPTHLEQLRGLDRGGRADQGQR